MAGLPDPISRRDILFDPKRSPAEKAAMGDAYFDAGRFNEAMDFYLAAASEPGAEKVKRLAIDQGDAFLLGRAAELLGGKVESGDWASLARKAVDSGKFRFAIKAFEKAGDAEGATRAREQLDAAMAQARSDEEAAAARSRAPAK